MSLEFAIFNLELATRSQRFYPVFKKSNFEVVCLDNAGATVAAPQDAERWGQVFDMAENASYSDFDRQEATKDTIVDKATSKFKPRMQGQATSPTFAPVHCECRLLQYLACSDMDPRPVRHIGVSKLSCAACTAVLSSWNQLQNRSMSRQHYMTRGSSRKWCWPWAIPRNWNGAWQEGRNDSESSIHDAQERVAFFRSVSRKMSERFMFSLAGIGLVKHWRSNNDDSEFEEVSVPDNVDGPRRAADDDEVAPE